MKILLVAPPYAFLSRYHFPVGIAYVSGMLKAQGFNVVCHNSALDDDWQGEFRRLLERERPDVLGVGALTPSYRFVKWMLATAKEVLPGVTTLLGGGILGSEPDVFDALGADIGVVGEGEEVTVELLRVLEQGGDLSQVAGILFRDAAGKTVNTGPRPFIEDLDGVPFPDYEGFNFRLCHEHQGTYDMNTSRGCPFHCTFCFSALGRGKHRSRSIDNVISEICHLVDTYGVKSVGLMDEVFALRKERILEFCDKVEPLKLAWYAQMRCSVVDEELLARMRQTGCWMVFYGLESMCPEVLQSMNKKLKPSEIERALEMTYQNRITVFGNFIFGDPAETMETAWQTLDWWLAHRKYNVNLGKIDCWPGTAIYHDALARGIIKDKIAFIEQGCPMINMTQMPEDEFMEMIRAMWLMHEGMIWPGTLLSAEVGEDGSASARCRCPHCDAENMFEHLESTPMHRDRQAHQLPCGECGRGFDLPLRLPPVVHSPEARELFAQAREEHAADRLDEAMERLLALFRLTGEHPAAVALAVSIRLKQGRPTYARELARLHIKANPTAPCLLEWAAKAFAACGDERMARIFRDQALMLREYRSPGLDAADMIRLDPMEHAYRELFPGGAETGR